MEELPGATRILVPIRTILLLGGVFLLGWALVSIADALLLVFTGVFLGIVFEYPVRFVEGRLGIGRGTAATIVVLGTAVVVTLLALLFLVPLVGAVRDLLQDLPQIVEELRQSDVFSSVGDTDAASHVQDASEALAQQIPNAVSEVIGLANEAFSAALAIFTLVFLALFFLTDVGNLKGALGSVLMPGDDGRWLGTYERITSTVSRWAIGVLIVAVIAGTVQGFTAFLLGSSYALALGLIAGLLDMIPNIGATIAAFITGGVLLAEEGVWQAVVMLVVVLVYQQVENNLITPTVQGKATNISPFFVILGVTVFAALLGVLGALVAVPLTAVIQIVLQEVTATRRAKVAEARARMAAVPAGGGGPGPAG